MSEDSEQESVPPESRLGREVGAQAERKLKARRQVTPGIWFGLGMMGLVGWSVAIPTLIGAVLGLWLDRRYPGGLRPYRRQSAPQRAALRRRPARGQAPVDG